MTAAKRRAPATVPDAAVPRAFPHNIDAERALLGAALQWSEVVFARAGDLRGCFHRPDHEALWGLLLDMRAAGDPVDMVAVPDRIGRLGALPFGGVAYVCSLPDFAPAWANVGYYAGLVREDARRRRVLEACQAAEERVYAGVDSVDEVVDDLISALVEVCE